MILYVAPILFIRTPILILKLEILMNVHFYPSLRK